MKHDNDWSTALSILPEPRLDPPSFPESLCWGLLRRCSGVPAPLWGVWEDGVLEDVLICLAAKSRSGIAFINSAWVSSSNRLMSWALYCVKLARFSSQSRSAACEVDSRILTLSEHTAIEVLQHWCDYAVIWFIVQNMWVGKRGKKRVKNSRNNSYQSDLHGQSFVSSSAAFQLLQGFALMGNRRMIVLVLAGRVPVATAEAGVGAPVGQAVAYPKVIDGEWWAGGDVKVRKFSQVVVVLWGRTREVPLLLPHPLIRLSGKTWKTNSLINSVKCNTN